MDVPTGRVLVLVIETKEFFFHSVGCHDLQRAHWLVALACLLSFLMSASSGASAVNVSHLDSLTVTFDHRSESTSLVPNSRAHHGSRLYGRPPNKFGRCWIQRF